MTPPIIGTAMAFLLMAIFRAPVPWEVGMVGMVSVAFLASELVARIT